MKLGLRWGLVSSNLGRIKQALRSVGRVGEPGAFAFRTAHWLLRLSHWLLRHGLQASKQQECVTPNPEGKPGLLDGAGEHFFPPEYPGHMQGGLRLMEPRVMHQLSYRPCRPTKAAPSAIQPPACSIFLQALLKPSFLTNFQTF